MIKAEGESSGKPEESAQLGQEVGGAIFPANPGAMVRKDPALLLGGEFCVSWVKPARVKGVMGSMASPGPSLQPRPGHL